jgi:manganese/zinc/iron transport system substrate-binding protein
MRACLSGLLVWAVLSGCSSNSQLGELDRWLADNGKLKVLCTIGMLDDLVGQVGGDRVDCISLIHGQLDPHSYSLVKGDDEKLQAASLIFYNGLGLEHGSILRHYLEDCGSCIAVGDYIAAQKPGTAIYMNGLLDPHIWTDVSLYALGVQVIVERLSKRDPEGATYYRENGVRLHQEMLAVHKEMRAVLQNIPSENRYLVTSHDAFNYFARAYLTDPSEEESMEWQQRVEAPEGLSPESQLSPLDIQRLIDHLKKYGITILFPESNVSQDSIRKIEDAGREGGLDLEVACIHLYADAMGKPGSDGDSYLKMMTHNATTIAHYLNGIKKP